MGLTLVSRHSIETLEKWVTDMFSPIVDKNTTLPDMG
jgi:hypothetical protein